MESAVPVGVSVESALSRRSGPLRSESAWSQRLRAGANWSGVMRGGAARSGSLWLAPPRSGSLRHQASLQNSVTSRDVAPGRGAQHEWCSEVRKSETSSRQRRRLVCAVPARPIASLELAQLLVGRCISPSKTFCGEIFLSFPFFQCAWAPRDGRAFG